MRIIKHLTWLLLLTAIPASGVVSTKLAPLSYPNTGLDAGNLTAQHRCQLSLRLQDLDSLAPGILPIWRDLGGRGELNPTPSDIVIIHARIARTV